MQLFWTTARQYFSSRIRLINKRAQFGALHSEILRKSPGQPQASSSPRCRCSKDNASVSEISRQID